MNRAMAAKSVSASEAGFEVSIGEQHKAAFEAEAAAGRRMATGAILVGLVVIAIWLFIQIGWERVWFYEVILALFALIFFADYRLSVSRLMRGRGSPTSSSPWPRRCSPSPWSCRTPSSTNWPTPTRLRSATSST